MSHQRPDIESYREMETDVMPAPPPRRRFWQIHLSTAVVVMIVGSLLVYQNVMMKNDAPDHYRPFFFGWPMSIGFEKFIFTDGDVGTPEFGHYEWRWALLPGVVNLAVALVILAATAFVSEYLLRHGSHAIQRPRLQLHLSTLFLVSLLASGLLWLNLWEWHTSDGVDYEFLARGWPWICHSRGWTDAYSLCMNVGVALGLLVLAAVVIEYIMAGRKRNTR